MIPSVNPTIYIPPTMTLTSSTSHTASVDNHSDQSGGDKNANETHFLGSDSFNLLLDAAIIVLLIIIIILCIFPVIRKRIKKKKMKKEDSTMLEGHQSTQLSGFDTQGFELTHVSQKHVQQWPPKQTDMSADLKNLDRLKFGLSRSKSGAKSSNSYRKFDKEKSPNVPTPTPVGLQMGNAPEPEDSDSPYDMDHQMYGPSPPNQPPTLGNDEPLPTTINLEYLEEYKASDDSGSDEINLYDGNVHEIVEDEDDEKAHVYITKGGPMPKGTPVHMLVGSSSFAQSALDVA